MNIFVNSLIIALIIGAIIYIYLWCSHNQKHNRNNIIITMVIFIIIFFICESYQNSSQVSINSISESYNIMGKQGQLPKIIRLPDVFIETV
jgi:K+-transporting ATPase A subunit